MWVHKEHSQPGIFLWERKTVVEESCRLVVRIDEEE